jgi:hypothetical protein
VARAHHFRCHPHVLLQRRVRLLLVPVDGVNKTSKRIDLIKNKGDICCTSNGSRMPEARPCATKSD